MPLVVPTSPALGAPCKRPDEVLNVAQVGLFVMLLGYFIPDLLLYSKGQERQKIMQLELALHGAQERHVGFVQADPDHMARFASPTRGFVNGDIGYAPSVDVSAGGDDSCRRDRLIGGEGRRSYVHGFHPLDYDERRLAA